LASDKKKKKRERHPSSSRNSPFFPLFLSSFYKNPFSLQKIKLEHRTLNALEEMEREKNADAAAAAEQDVRRSNRSSFGFFFVFSAAAA